MSEVKAWLEDLIRKIEDAEPETLPLIVILAAAGAMLQKKRERVQEGEWVSPEEAVKEFGLSEAERTRLYRHWKKMPLLCRPARTGGRGFQVNRKVLSERGGRFGGAGASARW